MNLSAQKTRHVNRPSAMTRPNAMHVFSFCQLSRDASESLGSACSRSCSEWTVLDIIKMQTERQMHKRFLLLLERRLCPAPSLRSFEYSDVDYYQSFEAQKWYSDQPYLFASSLIKYKASKVIVCDFMVFGKQGAGSWGDITVQIIFFSRWVFLSHN